MGPLFAAALLALLLTQGALAQTAAVPEAPAEPAASTEAPAADAGAAEATAVRRLCAAPRRAPEVWGRYARGLSERLSLTESQQGLLKDWQAARIKAREARRATLCAPAPDTTTFAGRLDLREKRLETQLAELRATRPRLEAFYAALSDQQRTAWDKARAEAAERRRRAR